MLGNILFYHFFAILGAPSEADLGMFSMFGEQGLHKKGVPQKHKKFIFCNMLTSQNYWNND